MVKNTRRQPAEPHPSFANPSVTRQTQTLTDRQTDRHRQADTDRHTEIDRDRERKTELETQSETGRDDGR